MLCNHSKQAVTGRMASETADVVLHVDLNKTLLAVDEVKHYGRDEVLYLEQWKSDEDFLRWAHETHGGDEPRDQWTAALKVSKEEPRLIGYAHEYCAADEGRKVLMAELMSKVDAENCANSFWRLLEWIQQQPLRVLLVFRTFGSDLPSMFDRVKARGYSDQIARDSSNAPLVWTMLHPADVAAGFGDFDNGKDVVCGMLQPGNPVPGPRQKSDPEFASRTVPFEKAAKAQFEAGEALRPRVYTAPPLVSDGRLQAIDAVDDAQLHDVTQMPALFRQINFSDGERLRIMGVQDNYKPWSRKNPRNGKVLVLDPALTQVCFDDYTFTKGEAEGTYIWALYGADGVPINGTKSELQQRFSAEKDFAGKPGNTPLMFTALLNKKGVEDTAVMNLEYFVSRFASALAAAPPMPPSQ